MWFRGDATCTWKLTLAMQSTPADIEIIYDVCWMLTPTQIQRMCTNYYVADYEVCDAAYDKSCILLIIRTEPHIARDFACRRVSSDC